MSIYEAELISEKIKNNIHYGKCFTGKDYDIFNEKNNELKRIHKCYDGIINYEKNLIDINYQNKIQEKKLNNEYDILERKLNSKKQEKENDIIIEEKKKENEINEMKKNLEIYKLQNNCELKQLNEDISNLEKEIYELDLQKKEEISLIKKKILTELNNEYTIKLIKYKNMKELEKERKKKDIEIKRKEFEAEKEIKLNEMRNKAELVQKIISMCKNISFN